MYVKYFLFYFIFIFYAFGQHTIPFYKNFTKFDYEGENAHWSITQSEKGVLYTANNHFLLRYDGSFWKKYQLPNKSIIRSVQFVSDTLYTGGYKEFGYWIEKEGELAYESLSKKFDSTNFFNDEIWKIIPYQNKILFQSFNHLYLYDSSTDSGEVIELPTPAIFCFKIDDSIYLTTKGKGIYRLNKTKFEYLPWSEPLKQMTIKGLAAFGQELLIGTELNGVFKYNFNTLRPWIKNFKNNENQFELNTISVIEDQVYVGSINKGLLVFDHQAQLRYVLDREKGLNNNTVLSQFRDQNNNLWLGLDNGLSVISLGYDIEFYEDYSGKLGTVFDIVKHPENNNLVIGTNHGIFVMDEQNDFDFIENSNGQVWDLEVIENEIIVGHNNGTFVLKDNYLKKISSISGGKSFVKIPKSQNDYLQTNYGGVTVFNKTVRSWNTFDFENYKLPSKKAIFNFDGSLWIASNFNGVLKYQTSFNPFSFSNKEEPFTENKIHNIFQFNKDILLTAPNLIYKHDVINDTLVRYYILEKIIGPFTTLSSIDGKRYLMKELNNDFTLFDLKTKSSFNFNSTLFSNKILKGLPHTKLINNKIYIFLDNGFMRFNPKITQTFVTPKKPVIVNVSYESNGIRKTAEALGPLSIKSKTNEIIFQFSSNTLFPINSIHYEYLLEGIADESWKKTSLPYVQKFTRLPYGDYKFRLRYVENGKYSSEAIYSFNVKAPWYISYWAFIGYFLLMAFIIRSYNLSKFRKKRALIEKEMNYQHLIEIEKEKLEKLKVFNQLEKENLESKIRSEEKELAVRALYLIKKNKTLSKVKKIIDKSDFKRNEKALYNELIRTLGQQDNLEEWKFFEQKFNDINQDFFRDLLIRFPLLTPGDLKLCYFLKMNLTSKEIAPLLGITYRSVELHRYRLRKKLKIKTETSFIKFLLQFNAE